MIPLSDFASARIFQSRVSRRGSTAVKRPSLPFTHVQRRHQSGAQLGVRRRVKLAGKLFIACAISLGGLPRSNL